MIVPHISYDLSFIECTEAHGIRVLKDLKGCRNEILGGESMRKSTDGPPAFNGPYCAYVVAARADGRLRIGS